MAPNTGCIAQRPQPKPQAPEKPAPPAVFLTPVIQCLPLDKVIPTPDNPRTVDPYSPAMKELTKNIEQVGVLSPVLVRPHPDKPGCYDLRAGERRWRAAKILGMKTINAIVREMSDQDAKKITVIENLHREDLSPLEEGRGIQTLLDAGWETKAIATELGKAASWVVRRAQLTKLSPAWLKSIADARDTDEIKHWGAAHLELVARLPVETQELLLRNSRCQEAMTLRDLERAIGAYTMELAKAGWKLDDAAIEPKAGACIACQKRSSCHPGLFEEVDVPAEKVKRRERCLDKACWDRKVDASLRSRASDLAAKHGKVQLVQESYYGEKRVAGAIDEYSLEECSKATKGSVCCLKVNGDDKGRVYWAVADGPRAGGGNQPRPVGTDGKPKPRSLEVRKKELNLRREALVNHALEELVEEEKSEWTKVGLTEDQLFRLVAAFGTREKNDTTTYRGGRENWGNYHKSADRKKMLAGLWDQVYPVLVQRLNFFPPLSNVPIREHEELAKLLTIDLAKLRADAAKEIPEPKCWGGLKADGSPKGASPANGKKAPEAKDAKPAKAAN